MNQGGRFVRRIYGDVFIRKIFYRFISWIWINNDIKGKDLKDCQDVVIDNIFNVDKGTFLRDMNEDTLVHTWQNKERGCVSEQVLVNLTTRVGIFGPLAGIMGRIADMEISKNPTVGWIQAAMFDHSIAIGQGALKLEMLTDHPSREMFDRNMGRR